MSGPKEKQAMTKSAFIKEVHDAEAMLYHVAKSILKNDADCCDAVQETLLKAYEKLDTLKKEKFFRTWITRILINECNGIIRKRKNIISVTTCYPVRRSWPTIRTCMPFTLPTTDAVLIPLYTICSVKRWGISRTFRSRWMSSIRQSVLLPVLRRSLTVSPTDRQPRCQKILTSWM